MKNRKIEPEIKEKELSLEGQRALKRWKRAQWRLRIGIAVLVLAVTIFFFGPALLYGYGQFQLGRGKYAEAVSTFEWLNTTAKTFRVLGKPGGRYRDCADKIRECHYRFGVALMEEGKYVEAKAEFIRSNYYGNSEALIKECSSLIRGE